MTDRVQQATGLFLRYHHRVLGVAFHAAPMPGLAEDITQDVFMEFVTHADRWDYEKDIGQLLDGITKNVALRYWREQKKRTSPKVFEVYEQLKSDMESKEQKNENMEGMLIALNICIEKLPPKSRKLVIEYYRSNDSMQKIATNVQKSANAIRLDLFRARKVLRNCIQRVLGQE